MEKELKEYLDRLSSEVAGIKETMATKEDLAGVKKSLTKEIRRVEKKFDNKFDNLLEYVEVVDKDISDHRRNTEAHIKPLKKA